MKLDPNNLEAFEKVMNPELLKFWNEFNIEVVEGLDYSELKAWQDLFKPFGLTFDYSLDAEPFDFELKI